MTQPMNTILRTTLQTTRNRFQAARFTLILLIIGLVTPAILSAGQEQWGHWRGPTGNGTSLTATPPVEFGSQKNCRWKQTIPGRGSSSPVIWNDQVFITTAVPLRTGDSTLDFRLLCFDRQTGSKQWEHSCIQAIPHEGTHSTNGYASASPCTNGTHVYAHFGSQGLYCLTMDGQRVWNKDFGNMQTRNEFGEGSSPTLVDDKIVIPWDHEGPSRLICLKATTGETLWDIPRDEPTCWATPLIVSRADGSKQVAMNGQNAARGYDLATGKELWQCSGQTMRPVASAVSADGLVLIGSGFRGSFLGCFDLTGNGNIQSSPHVHWTVSRNTPDIASPLLHDGKIWFYKGKTGLLTCLNIHDGTPVYEQKRIEGVSHTYASPVAANGFIFMTDRGGTITVIRDGDEPVVISVNEMEEGVDATPALIDSELFIRGETTLFCITEN
ncbi:PQQ-binding-like beta-propeller repeat protein [Pirellulales bacterium]|nr:PQQ-binding-like beta-propeller repeat protein [Pirellulales bacterium]